MSTRRKRKKHNASSPIEDSISRSMLATIEKELDLDGLFDGEIVHLSFDCPRRLRDALVYEARDNGDSVCKVLQHKGFSYVVGSRIKKHALGSTLRHLLDVDFNIENLSFQQYNQSRPRRIIKEKTTEASEEQATCQIGQGECKEVAIGEGIYKKTGKKYRLCRMHMNYFANYPNDWALIN